MICLLLFLFGCWMWPISMPLAFIVLGVIVGLVELVVLNIFTSL